MKSSKHKNNIIGFAYIGVVLIMTFTYFVYYRTQSRVNWYNEMQIQKEHLIEEVRDILGISW